MRKAPTSSDPARGERPARRTIFAAFLEAMHQWRQQQSRAIIEQYAPLTTEAEREASLISDALAARKPDPSLPSRPVRSWGGFATAAVLLLFLLLHVLATTLERDSGPPARSTSERANLLDHD